MAAPVVVVVRVVVGSINNNIFMLKIEIKKSILIIIGACIFIAIGFFIGEVIEVQKNNAVVATEKETELRISGYKYVNPLLECNIQSYLTEPTSAKFAKMKDDIIARKEAANLKTVSVYFRDLNNGPWLGLDEKELFTPASLLKVPLMIALFKQRETNPVLFSSKIIYHKQTVLPQDIDGNYSFVDGKEYTVLELIKIMITYSNNEATQLLLGKIDQGVLKKVYDDFALPIPGQEKNNEDFMSVKQYAAFFRILYNGSYLSPAASEEALAILSKSTFNEGIVAGLPAEVNVVHKFGERKYMLDGKETNQLHDCGIVYAKNHNYIMCIMTRGYDFEIMKTTIRDISKIIYDSFVDGK